MLHGRGADEEDLLGIAPSLDERFLILSARAPFPYAYGGTTWYDVGNIGTPEPSTFRRSCGLLGKFIDDALAGYSVDPKRFILFGFSMGAVMSLAMALTRPATFRGVAANSGYIAEGTDLVYRWQELSQTDVLITHGLQDPVIPVAMARRARDLFALSNAPVMYREYAAGHHFTDESLADIVAWTRRFLTD